MSETKIANRYAEALMQQAVADNQLSAVADSMANISATCRNSKDLRNALSSPIINPLQKQNALLTVFKSSHQLVINFIKLVCSKNRENILLEIADCFLDLYRKNQGIEKVSVQSATELNESDKTSIQQYVQKLTGAKSVELHTEINPSVIGGMVIKFGDNLLDSSVAAKLRKLKKELNIA
jgi:F-type H+-transporting ATPase subunit delta